MKKLCWKCGKPSHFKKKFKSKTIEKGKGSKDNSSIENKSSTEEGENVHLDSTGTQSESDFWLIDSGASFHMTAHREWFYEYERYNVNVFLGDDSPKKFTGRGIVKLLSNDRWIKTIPGVLHIPGPAKNLIYVNTMANVGVQTILEKHSCKMV